MNQKAILQHGGPHSVRARAFQNFVRQHGLVNPQGPLFPGQSAGDSTQSSLSSTGSFHFVQFSGVVGSQPQPMELEQPDVRDEAKLADSYEAADLSTRQQLLCQERSFFHTAEQY